MHIGCLKESCKTKYLLVRQWNRQQGFFAQFHAPQTNRMKKELIEEIKKEDSRVKLLRLSMHVRVININKITTGYINQDRSFQPVKIEKSHHIVESCPLCLIHYSKGKSGLLNQCQACGNATPAPSSV